MTIASRGYNIRIWINVAMGGGSMFKKAIPIEMPESEK